MCVQKCDLISTDCVLTAVHRMGYLCLTSTVNLSFLLECLPSLCSYRKNLKDMRVEHWAVFLKVIG